MVNLHSHAFQRAMAGLAEVALNPDDSFWSWRELMYRLVGRAAAGSGRRDRAPLYIEMLKGGYTSVAEFHYLHHDVDGRPYADPAEMSRRILNAAQATGIRLTLLPVMCAHGGFGGTDPSAAQRRFIHRSGSLSRLAGVTRGRLRQRTRRRWVPASTRSGRSRPEEMTAVQQGMRPGLAGPGSISPSSRRKSKIALPGAASGRSSTCMTAGMSTSAGAWCTRPMPTTAEVDARWRRAVRWSVICPTTEANLGDGLLPGGLLHRAGWTVRHRLRQPCLAGRRYEELRWLEYGQRSKHERRNRLHGGGQNNIGTFLYEAALEGGALAMGQKVGRIEAGAKADLLVLDSRHPRWRM